jgi:hypothetical protein
MLTTSIISHGYSTEICHIGFPTESSTAENPLPPNSHFATNACIFRVLPTPPPSSIRSPRSYRSSPLPFYQKSADAEGRFGGSHQLFKRVMFRPRPSVEHVKKFKPGENAGLVRQCLRDLMKAWGVSEVKLSDVWSGADEYSDQLTDRCGGSQRFLIKVSSTPIRPPWHAQCADQLHSCCNVGSRRVGRCRRSR